MRTQEPSFDQPSAGQMRSSEGEVWTGGPGLLRSLWRFRVIVLGATLLAATLGYWYALGQPAMYRATSTLVLRDPNAPRVLGQGGGGRPQDIEAHVARQAELAMSGNVLERTSQILGGAPKAVALQQQVVATPDVTVLSVVIAVSAPDPTIAATIANAVGEAYQQVVAERTAADAQRAVDQLEQTRARLQGELDASLRASARAGQDVLTPQQTTLANRISETQARMDQIRAEAALQGAGIELFELATPPLRPASPQPLRDAALGGLISFVGAGIYAWWAAGRNRRADDRNEPAGVLQAPLLGEVPKAPAARLETGHPIPSPSMQGPAVEEAFHFVVASLEHVLASRGGSSVVVTSASSVHAEHKSLTVLGMAISALRDRRRVVLVDGDDRARRLSKLVGREDTPGFTDLSNEAVPVEMCLQELDLADGSAVPVLPCGTQLDHPAAFFRTPASQKALMRVGEQADLVLIDTPPILTVSDTVALASQADAVVLVVDQGTPLKRLGNVRERLAFVGAPLIGYVFSSPPSVFGLIRRGRLRVPDIRSRATTK
jgi:Mrp family chromosome partitioning ATPase